MARGKQNNKYVIQMKDGFDVILTASKLSEAYNIAKRIDGAITVQRVFKNATEKCQSVNNKVYSI